MAFKGQPTPSTILPARRAKVSDGKAVRVKAAKAVQAQNFYLIDGFFGVALKDAEAGEELELQIEQAEYETDNIVTTEAFNTGDLIYWNKTKFTTTATDNKLVGRVTEGKDSNNVIWFILLPQA